MRWELLFEDLQSQFDAAARREDEAETLELAEAELGQVELADRLRARLGEQVSVRLRSGQGEVGTVLDAAPQWLLVGEGERRVLIPLRAVALAWPLGAAAPPTGAVERRLRVTHALRGIARQATRVQVSHEAGETVGWIVRVGADHLDLEVDHGSAVADRGQVGRGAGGITVALDALLAVRTR